ncbi:MAG: helix-turn-helix domain-containing protein [Acidobacteria bacterium]|nr:helix-turn-helix domain-containing protein [Acidobacteriota bacterium]
MEIRRVFASNLRRLRTERGLSQEGLADAAGIDRTYVSALEREQYSVSIDTLAKLAAALEVPRTALLESSEPPGKRPQQLR